MTHTTNRLLALVAVSTVLFVAPAGTAIAHATPAPAAAPAVSTQHIGGGGIGSRTADPAPVVEHRGNYSSTGQLGSGHYFFSDGEPVDDVPFVGQASFLRSDGTRLEGTTRKTPGACGLISDNTYCLTVTLGPGSDIARADLKLTVLVDFGKSARTSFLMTGSLTLSRRIGYAMLGVSGTVYAFGGIDHLGDANTHDTTDIERTPTGSGYWIVNDQGNVFAFGDARYFGNANPAQLGSGERVTSMSATPTGKGYWLFTSKGRALVFGDAKFLGDLHTTALNGGIVGSNATPTGNGYYMVGTDGGVFAFGDARFRGSMGNARLNRPVVGLVPTTDNRGYWLVASDGGVFSFNAQFRGSLGNVHLNEPVVTMVPYGTGYLMVAADGGVFNFSARPFFGSEGGNIIFPVVSGTAAG